MSLHSPEPRAPLAWKTVLALLLFTYLFINTAWVTEDAFITFRSVNQLLAGNGPVWNLGERVQVYTHPLWYGLLVLTTGLGLPSYWGALLLSFLCLLGVLALLFHLARRLERSVSKGNASETNGRHRTASSGGSASLLLALLFLLSLSRSFIDYSTSGLENPLLHLLLLAYLAVYLSDQPPAKRFFWTTFIYGLIFLTRPDGIILLTPASVLLWGQMLKARQPWLKPALLALSPVIAWELFSLIYYGSLVPNTALAKLNMDYPVAILRRNAWAYFHRSAQFDPLALPLIVMALVAGLLQGLRRSSGLLLALTLGLVLQLGYIIHVGADYMLGRFLSAPLLLAVVVLLLGAPAATTPPARRLGRWLGLGGAVLLLLWQPFNYRSSWNFYSPETIRLHDNEERRFFNDERGAYYRNLGLLRVLFAYQGKFGPEISKYISGGQSAAGQHHLSCFVGMYVWGMSLDKQVIDPLALTEPFLARLPARDDARVGHYERVLPPGFLLSRRDGVNRLKEPHLATLYEDVLLATRSPELFSWARLAAIWRLNTGHHRDMGRYFDRNDVNLRELGIDDWQLLKSSYQHQTLTLLNDFRPTACIHPLQIK